MFPRPKLKFNIIHLLQLASGLWEHANYSIAVRLFSRKLQELFVSVEVLWRVWILSEGAGVRQQVGKSWFLTPGRLDFTFSGTATVRKHCLATTQSVI